LNLPLIAQTLRDQEIAQCLPGEIATWGDQKDRAALASPMVFVYDHSSAPAWFDETLVRQAVNLSAASWSRCGVSFTVEGVTSKMARITQSVRIQWSEEGSRHNFGLANLTERTLSLGPAAFQLLKERNPAFDSRQTLQMVISHEMGHLFGVMSHSRRCVDVTSYYDNGKGEKCFIRDGSTLPRGGEYRSLFPTACDIQRCRVANGFSAQP
jgi:hypothetical protein